MIQPQELRIGNWVLCQQSYAVVTQILAPDLLDLRCEDGCNRFCNIADVSPIELSAEVLAKCGFTKSPLSWNLDITFKRDGYEYETKRQICVAGDYVFLEEGDDLKSGNRDMFTAWNQDLLGRRFYLHELQNLIFSLTRQELSFTP